jgi:hypothetical protein
MGSNLTSNPRSTISVLTVGSPCSRLLLRSYLSKRKIMYLHSFVPPIRQHSSYCRPHHVPLVQNPPEQRSEQVLESSSACSERGSRITSNAANVPSSSPQYAIVVSIPRSSRSNACRVEPRMLESSSTRAMHSHPSVRGTSGETSSTVKRSPLPTSQPDAPFSFEELIVNVSGLSFHQ